MCRYHLDQRAERSRRKNKALKESGKCPMCKSQVRTRHVYCYECRKKRTKWNKKARRRLIEKGLCPCGKKAAQLKNYCESCAVIRNVVYQRPHTFLLLEEEHRLMKNTLESIVELGHPESDLVKQARFCLDSLKQ